MSLHILRKALQDTAGLKAMAATIKDSDRVLLIDVPGSARTAVMSIVAETVQAPSLIVTARSDRAMDLVAQLREFSATPAAIEYWPAPDTLPYEQLPWDSGVSARRVALLDRLLRHEAGQPLTVVASVAGLTHLVMPAVAFQSGSRRVRAGDQVNLAELHSWAINAGYQPAPLVQEPGVIARRGGLLDLFPPQAEYPVRFDFFGDTLESIRRFDFASQRSDAALDCVTLLPPAELPLWQLRDVATRLAELDDHNLRGEVRQEWRRTIELMAQGHTPLSLDLFAPWFSDGAATLFDYLPENTVLIIEDRTSIELAASQREQMAQELEQGFVANGELPSGLRRPVAAWEEVSAQLDSRHHVTIGDDGGAATNPVSLDMLSDAPLFAGRLKRAVLEIQNLLEAGWRITIATSQAERLTELLEEEGVLPIRRTGAASRTDMPLRPGEIDLLRSDLDAGWSVPADRLLLLTDLELFGFRRQTRKGVRRTSTPELASIADLPSGSFVVHVDHGISVFQGLVRRETSGVEREYLLLEYARGDRLLVPVDQSHRVSRYSGGGAEPRLTTLGSGEWVRTRQKVRRSVREMAFQLIQLYAARESAPGHSYGPDTTWDLELAESFSYVETTDQRGAIDDVRRDMESDRPMDRLICGDVGFGKTEVALRAAFKAVNAGRQVALLVPTTVLALQHYSTFSNRLAAFPVRIEMLSRLRSESEQRQIARNLRDGAIDIVIGTHRLVQKDINFKNLGLVIIDEEQRFGVRQKEFLRQLRTEVDTLTMSATPIPRTLHMSLAGIRDVSIIDTPPQDRMPVRTFVTEASDHLLREVIVREIERGGQAYVVHNRVMSIDRMAQKLRSLLPGVRITVGHGQMDEHELEDVMVSFIRHDSDVLLCTTIIESGVDIPNVNTIVIDNADTFGLTQLHQLRGRVGRSTNRAYAYLLHRKGKPLTIDAMARLEAIQEASELGAGLRVAMRDMEIRGAGNLLGAEQSGHIAEVGFDLYIRLLSQAVEEIRQGKPFADQQGVTLDLPISALLPADYIQDVELRLATYRRISAVTTAGELAGMSNELEDRFGPLPAEAERLMAVISLRIRAEELGLESLIEREREIVIRPVHTASLNQMALESSLGHALKLTPNSVRIRLTDLDQPWRDALEVVLEEIERAQRTQSAG